MNEVQEGVGRRDWEDVVVMWEECHAMGQLRNYFVVQPFLVVSIHA